MVEKPEALDKAEDMEHPIFQPFTVYWDIHTHIAIYATLGNYLYDTWRRLRSILAIIFLLLLLGLVGYGLFGLLASGS